MLFLFVLHSSMKKLRKDKKMVTATTSVEVTIIFSRSHCNCLWLHSTCGTLLPADFVFSEISIIFSYFRILKWNITILEKIIWTKKRNQAKMKRTKRLRYLFLRNFQVVWTTSYFLKGNWALGSTFK